MKKARVVMLSLSMVLGCSLFGAAQQSAASAANATVPPPLMPFSSVAVDEGGSSLSGVVNITFSLYNGQQGGEPLWTETQNNVQLDATGHYSVQLGITQPAGVPSTLFITGEARWLEVQIAGQAPQPRVLLLSVPYAMKAGDAATIGGLPPSAFVLAAPLTGSTQSASVDSTGVPLSSAPPPAGTPVTGTGTVNFLPLWDTTSDIISSVLFQSGTGASARVGIGTTAPATTLDVKGSATVRGTLSLPATGVATATKGANSQPMTMAASAYNTTAAVSQTFQLQAEAVNNDTTAASGTLNFLFGSGTSKPAETGLHIASNGQITFASGQMFPGTGTITGITTASSSGLTGGGTSGTLGLGLLTTCATGQVLQWNGTAWACATVGGGGSGTVTSVGTGLGLLGGPITTSGTLTIDTTKVPLLATANTFTGNQTVTGNVIATAGYQIQFAGTNYLFDYGSPFTGAGLGNSYLGFAGNATTTGAGNVAAGWAALLADTTGADNTAVGVSALFTNSSGINNTAVGMDALFATGGGSTSTGNGNTAMGYKAAYSNNTGYSNTAIGAQALYDNAGGVYNTATGTNALYNNTTGNYNTAIGYQAGPSTGALTNSTAIGANALVSVSNALVLGGTGSNAVNVGIGTASPAYTLDAAGTIRSSSGGFMFPDGTTQTTAATSGSITGVTAGTGLTGGGTSGNVTLSINTATIPQLGTTNTFTGSQNVGGTLTAGTSSSSTSGVFGEALVTSGQTYGVGGLAVSPAGYGVWGLNDATTGGAGVYGSSAATTGYGVEGVNTSSAGTGVYGTAPSFGVQGIASGSGTTVGVFGTGRNGVQGNGTANGVSGNASGAGSTGVYGTGQSFGVQAVGTGTGSTGAYGTASLYGLEGVATGGSGTAGVFGTGANGLQGTGTVNGVYGSGPNGVYGSGTTNGVYGTSSGAATPGVYGTSASLGVQGVATGTTAPSVGVYGTGVWGLQGNGTSWGVYGTTSAGIAGSYGAWGGPSETGEAQYFVVCENNCGINPNNIQVYTNAAVWADTNCDNCEPTVQGENGGWAPSLLSTADNDIAAFFINNSGLDTLYAANLGSGGSGDDVIHAEGTAGSCTLTGGGDTACTGVLKSVVATAGGTRVETYAVQSAENWFEDAGTAQLVNGAGRVNLESVFGQTVNTSVDYHVFLTPDGDCKGLYVSAKTASGFEVRELSGGTSSVAFEYRIMAKRVGYENVRLADTKGRFTEQLVHNGKVPHRARQSATPQARPQRPTPPVPPVRAGLQTLADPK